MKNLSLEEFPHSTYDDWKKLALKELREQSYDTLIWQNENGFDLAPYYTQSSTQTPTTTNRNEPWSICQTITGKNPEELNKNALTSLMGGVNFIKFHYSFQSYEQLKSALNGVGIAYITIQFDCPSITQVSHTYEWLRQYCEENSIDSNSLRGAILLDAFIALKHIAELKTLVDFARNTFPNFRLFSINTNQIHNSGGNASQDIAFSLSVGNELLHQLTSLEVTPNDAVKLLQFNFATDSSYFVEIAKYRVFRNLWNLIIEKYNASKTEVLIHAETSTFLQTTRDYYNNLLRATTQAMSAAIGMVDSIEIIPHDNSYTNASEDSLRLARNVQHLLLDESYLSNQVDLAAGSHYQETLAQELTTVSWDLFLEIEKNGGILLFEKQFRQMVESSKRIKLASLHSGERTVVGVNKYINKNEHDAEGTSNRLTSQFILGQ